MRKATSRLTRLCLGGASRAALFAILAASASAQTRPWTTVGSAGTIDEGDLSEVRLVQNEATLVAGAGVGTVSTIRYNIVATDDVSGLGVPRLTIRYRTGDGTGRVVVRLKRANFNPGGVPLEMTVFDSNDHPATGNPYVTRTHLDCATPAFNFVNNAYFIEVELHKNGANGNPGLGSIKVDLAPHCGG